MAPVLERIATEKESRFILAKANTSDNPRMTRKLNIRSVPTVKIFDNGKVVAEFVGGRTEPFIRQILTDVASLPRPTAALKVSDAIGKRFKQGKSYLNKGKGFEATIAFRDFPSGDPKLSAEANQLLPLAQFLWDLDDGDGWTGRKKIDKLYEEVLVSMEDRQPAQALTTCHELIKLVSKEDRPQIEKLVIALEVLMRKNG